MQRMGMVIRIKAKHIDEYKKLHANAWPEILQSLTECNITNYSIFLRQPENLLFGYWEYVGTDFEDDMRKIAAMEITKQWWKICMPCQKKMESCSKDEWWAMMEQVFYHP